MENIINTFITASIFIFILLVLVVVHELGHFWAAKKAGIKVEEFGVGLPPKLWGKQVGETEYTVNLLPIGGFVRMYGEMPDGVSIKEATSDERQATGDAADESRAFTSKSPAWRSVVLLAGVAANLVLGIVIFGIVYTVGLPQYSATPVISEVNENSPAAAAGLEKGQTILALNGVKYDDIEPSFSAQITELKGQEVVMRVANEDGTEEDVVITPRTEIPAGQGALGVVIGAGDVYQSDVVRYPFWQAGWEGTKQAIGFAGMILGSLGSMIGGLSQGNVPQDLAGPVGIASVIGEARSFGWVPVLFFAGIISINLAVINILPFPALDGGRLVFVAIEAITRRKVSPKVEAIVNTAGMAALLLLIAAITVSDISKFF